MASTPYMFFIKGLTKRQPMVVSKICGLRPNAASALGITNGARLMLSTPPAIIKPASPARMARAAVPKASMPEPHKRLMVAPGISRGKPANKLAMCATLRLSSPAWFTQPYSTSVTAAQSTWGLRAIRAFKGTAAKSSARTEDKAPP